MNKILKYPDSVPSVLITSISRYIENSLKQILSDIFNYLVVPCRRNQSVTVPPTFAQNLQSVIHSTLSPSTTKAIPTNHFYNLLIFSLRAQEIENFVEKPSGQEKSAERWKMMQFPSSVSVPQTILDIQRVLGEIQMCHKTFNSFTAPQLCAFGFPLQLPPLPEQNAHCLRFWMLTQSVLSVPLTSDYFYQGHLFGFAKDRSEAVLSNFLEKELSRQIRSALSSLTTANIQPHPNFDVSIRQIVSQKMNFFDGITRRVLIPCYKNVQLKSDSSSDFISETQRALDNGALKDVPAIINHWNMLKLVVQILKTPGARINQRGAPESPWTWLVLNDAPMTRTSVKTSLEEINKCRSDYNRICEFSEVNPQIRPEWLTAYNSIFSDVKVKIVDVSLEIPHQNAQFIPSDKASLSKEKENLFKNASAAVKNAISKNYSKIATIPSFDIAVTEKIRTLFADELDEFFENISRDIIVPAHNFLPCDSCSQLVQKLRGTFKEILQKSFSKMYVLINHIVVHNAWSTLVHSDFFSLHTHSSSKTKASALPWLWKPSDYENFDSCASRLKAVQFEIRVMMRSTDAAQVTQEFREWVFDVQSQHTAITKQFEMCRSKTDELCEIKFASFNPTSKEALCLYWTQKLQRVHSSLTKFEDKCRDCVIRSVKEDEPKVQVTDSFKHKQLVSFSSDVWPTYQKFTSCIGSDSLSLFQENYNKWDEVRTKSLEEQLDSLYTLATDKDAPEIVLSGENFQLSDKVKPIKFCIFKEHLKQMIALSLELRNFLQSKSVDWSKGLTPPHIQLLRSFESSADDHLRPIVDDISRFIPQRELAALSFETLENDLNLKVQKVLFFDSTFLGLNDGVSRLFEEWTAGFSNLKHVTDSLQEAIKHNRFDMENLFGFDKYFVATNFAELHAHGGAALVNAGKFLNNDESIQFQKQLMNSIVSRTNGVQIQSDTKFLTAIEGHQPTIIRFLSQLRLQALQIFSKHISSLETSIVQRLGKDWNFQSFFQSTYDSLFERMLSNVDKAREKLANCYELNNVKAGRELALRSCAWNPNSPFQNVVQDIANLQHGIITHLKNLSPSEDYKLSSSLSPAPRIVLSDGYHMSFEMVKRFIKPRDPSTPLIFLDETDLKWVALYTEMMQSKLQILVPECQPLTLTLSASFAAMPPSQDEVSIDSLISLLKSKFVSSLLQACHINELKATVSSHVQQGLSDLLSSGNVSKKIQKIIFRTIPAQFNRNQDFPKDSDSLIETTSSELSSYIINELNKVSVPFTNFQTALSIRRILIKNSHPDEVARDLSAVDVWSWNSDKICLDELESLSESVELSVPASEMSLIVEEKRSQVTVAQTQHSALKTQFNNCLSASNGACSAELPPRDADGSFVVQYPLCNEASKVLVTFDEVIKSFGERYFKKVRDENHGLWRITVSDQIALEASHSFTHSQWAEYLDTKFKRCFETDSNSYLKKFLDVSDLRSQQQAKDVQRQLDAAYVSIKKSQPSGPRFQLTFPAAPHVDLPAELVDFKLCFAHVLMDNQIQNDRRNFDYLLKRSSQGSLKDDLRDIDEETREFLQHTALFDAKLRAILSHFEISFSDESVTKFSDTIHENLRSAFDARKIFDANRVNYSPSIVDFFHSTLTSALWPDAFVKKRFEDTIALYDQVFTRNAPPFASGFCNKDLPYILSVLDVSFFTNGSPSDIKLLLEQQSQLINSISHFVGTGSLNLKENRAHTEHRRRLQQLKAGLLDSAFIGEIRNDSQPPPVKLLLLIRDNFLRSYNDRLSWIPEREIPLLLNNGFDSHFKKIDELLLSALQVFREFQKSLETCFKSSTMSVNRRKRFVGCALQSRDFVVKYVRILMQLELFVFEGMQKFSPMLRNYSFDDVKMPVLPLYPQDARDANREFVMNSIEFHQNDSHEEEVEEEENEKHKKHANKEDPSSSSKTGMIIGIVFGCLAVVGLGVGAFFFIRQRKKNRPLILI
eukprot:GDKJ01013687.1.p1 GENE.GDKJ01013687.1~~GDKJ01013687.1.p1  ORF type:complete len:2114 (+),score=444.83 GDKJ01013687.1:456-6344(+)